MRDLFTPLRLGPYTLPHRIIMAPLTRSRSPGRVPNELNAEYYRQRADPNTGASLIISEAVTISPTAAGYPDTPGIYTPEQVAGWKLVTRAVHAAGGLIFAQLWHVGRVSHPVFQPDGTLPVAPSALSPGGVTRTPAGELPRVIPRALERDEIPLIIADYRAAARHALAAGFDGVELHGANCYLPHQFLSDGSNHRTDDYGGSLANRARFMLEAAQACIDVWGADRIGIRLSPSSRAHHIGDSNQRSTFEHIVRALDALHPAYLHIMEAMGVAPDYDPIPVAHFRPLCHAPVITNSNFTRAKGDQYLADGTADAVAFGKLFISNPDLSARFRRNAPVAPWDSATFYTPGPRGYTDYPALTPSSV